MALTKTTKPSIIKTRAQSRTGTTARTGTTTRTGTHVRTNDDTIAPAPVAVTTPGRTIDSVDPVAVVTDPAPVDLFAGRPTTGALKDPPAPRDRDSDDAKKPAAKPKPKGRPKKVVAPKAATRKPRKPRNVDANELVDPMANIHVGVVTAGGYAEATGNDPVLANPEQLEPEQPEPQPKKKTRRTTRASRRPR